MQRYFVPADQITGNSVTVTGEDARHITKVMRFREGEQIIVSDGQGKDVTAAITLLSSERVEGQIIGEISEKRELPVRVTIAQSLPKGDKMDMVIQKGTELGAASFFPYVSARSVVRLDDKKEEKRGERWRKIAKEAAEQAHRSLIPDISSVFSWRQLLDESRNYDAAVLAYEQENSYTLHRVLAQCSEGAKILLVIGPEGGFSEEEVQQAQESGFHVVSLGKRILRTETAGLYALACVSYHFEQIGGQSGE